MNILFKQMIYMQHFSRVWRGYTSNLSRNKSTTLPFNITFPKNLKCPFPISSFQETHPQILEFTSNFVDKNYFLRPVNPAAGFKGIAPKKCIFSYSDPLLCFTSEVTVLPPVFTQNLFLFYNFFFIISIPICLINGTWV